jgi:hypothetical protein
MEKKSMKSVIYILGRFKRGASAAYFPKVVSSLVIPPYSDRLTQRSNSRMNTRIVLIKIDDFEDDEREDRIKKD